MKMNVRLTGIRIRHTVTGKPTGISNPTAGSRDTAIRRDTTIRRYITITGALCVRSSSMGR